MKHEKEWVGSWADAVPDPAVADRYNQSPFGPARYEFQGGLLTKVNVAQLSVGIARAVAAAPELRFVRDLFVGGLQDEDDEGPFEPGPDIPEDVDRYHAQYP